MKILFVNSDETCFDEVTAALANNGCALAYMDAPTELNESFVTGLLNQVKAETPDYIMSLGYYQHLSNACGIMSLNYISWIVSGYDPTYYDPSVKNEWNIIFTVDMKLYREFVELGIKNLFFLPLAPENAYLNTRVNRSDSEEKSVLVISESLYYPEKIETVLPKLLNSTKGYLDAFCENKKYDLTTRPIYKRLHDYIREDIESKYKLEAGGLEKYEDAFDNRAFYPHIDDSSAVEYISELVMLGAPDRITTVSYARPAFDDERVTSVSRRDVGIEFYKDSSRFIYALIMPGFLSGTRITQDMWNLMALGYVVFLPEYIDTECLGDNRPLSFKNLHELLVLARHISGKDFERNPNELISRADQLREEILQNDSYEKRIEALLSVLQ